MPFAHSPFARPLRAMTASRRPFLGGAVAVATFLLGASRGEAKRKRKRQKEAQPNQFGCIDVGDACKRADHCCSGICKGKKGKKRCRAHDTGDCRQESICSVFDEEGTSCLTTSGLSGRCGTTTGNAGYCVGAGDCFACTKDADCRAICGPQAACVLCPEECDVGTICAGPDGTVCPL